MGRPPAWKAALRGPHSPTAKSRWDKAHMATAATKLKTEQIEQFDAVCASAGLTRYEAIRRFCLACIMRPSTLDGLRWKRASRKRS